ncbi:MAG: hypothetical protein ACE5JK_07755, partial [Candidatus Omnitrophota bacterium]
MKNILPAIILVSVLACAISSADDKDQPIKVTAKVDKDKVNIGDRIKLDISVKNTSGKEIAFPEPSKNLGEFSVLDSHPSKEGRVYVLSIYTTGTHVIPPVTVEYRTSGEEEWQAKVGPQVPIEVLSVLTGEDTDIKDLKGLAAIQRGVFGLFLTLVIIAALAVLAFFIWRKRTAQTFPGEIKPKPAHVIACEELSELRAMDLPGKGQVKEYYIRLSDIVRHYLENRFLYRAPEMTTEEFLNVIKDSKEFGGELRDL